MIVMKEILKKIKKSKPENNINQKKNIKPKKKIKYTNPTILRNNL
jgi:hypothetical protein